MRCPKKYLLTKKQFFLQKWVQLLTIIGMRGILLSPCPFWIGYFSWIFSKTFQICTEDSYYVLFVKCFYSQFSIYTSWPQLNSNYAIDFSVHTFFYKIEAWSIDWGPYWLIDWSQQKNTTTVKMAKIDILRYLLMLSPLALNKIVWQNYYCACRWVHSLRNLIHNGTSWFKISYMQQTFKI